MRLSYLITFTFCLQTVISIGQPNCNIYGSNPNDSCYKACIEATTNNPYYQGQKGSLIQLDKAIELCPDFAYAYWAKGIPYLKRGDFITWFKLINKAVELAPTEYLGYRGWCRYQFLRDYEGAIQDIEQLKKLVTYDIGYCQNGDYHLDVALALCYKAMGEKDKATQLIRTYLQSEIGQPDLCNYLHLGKLYLETNQVALAIEALKQQIDANDYYAETYFYLAECNLIQGNLTLAKSNISKAEQFYDKGYHRVDPYSNPMDRIYRSDIENMQVKIEQMASK